MGVDTMKEENFIIELEHEGKRLDKFLADKYQKYSRTYIQKLIDINKITVNGNKIKKSYEVVKGDKVSVIIPPPKKPDIKPVAMELDIIFEDENIIVINKPSGLVVHPAPGNWNNTLVNGLLAYTDDLSGINGIKRPGIVHRLDKDTSGVMIVAKNNNSHQSLAEQFKKRKVKKVYHTIVKGVLPYESGKIDAPIGRDPDNRKKMAVKKNNSKKAVTSFKLLEKRDNFSYVQIQLLTGRTHQIRVHFSYIGHPVVGDKKYGNNNNQVSRQLLHAREIGINHPVSGKWKTFLAPIPSDFNEFWNQI